MPDFTTYFDKHPFTNYSLGPSGSGAKNPQPFTTDWISWFIPSQGVYYQKLSAFGVSVPSFLSEINYPNAAAFSFTFESGSNLYYALEQNNTIYVVHYSGTSKIVSPFPGESPALFNNSVLQLSGNETSCFYLKGDANIYFRNGSENFGTERVYHSGQKIWKQIERIYKNPITGFLYRFGIHVIDSEGNGSLLISDKYDPFNQSFFQGFSNVASGSIQTLPLWDMEQATTVFVSSNNFYSDAFGSYPTGVTLISLSGQQSGTYYSLSGGYFIHG